MTDLPQTWIDGDPAPVIRKMKLQLPRDVRHAGRAGGMHVPSGRSALSQSDAHLGRRWRHRHEWLLDVGLGQPGTAGDGSDCLFDFYAGTNDRHVRIDFNGGLRVWINSESNVQRMQTFVAFRKTRVHVALHHARGGTCSSTDGEQALFDANLDWPGQTPRTHRIGRSAFGGDPWFEGQMRDFFWWDEFISELQLEAVAADNTDLAALRSFPRW